MPFPVVQVGGTPYEMGLQHGRQAREQVRAFVEHVIRAARPSVECPADTHRERVLGGAAQFLPWFEAHAPVLLDEVRGLAEGAGLSFAEALLPQIRGEIAPLVRNEGCTTFAVAAEQTTTGGRLIGQTSDMERAMEDYFLVLHVLPSQGPRLLMWTFAGQLGYHGVSEWGVAHFANSVSGGPASPRGIPGGVPHYPLKRRLYECRTQADVLALFHQIPVCSSGNYMLSAGGGCTGDAASVPAIFDVEATPAGPALLEDSAGEGFLVHTNHFLSPCFRTAETDRAALPDSFPRLDRMTSLLQEARGKIGVDRMRTFLADHANHPCSICRHEGDGEGRMVTVGGLIAEPDAGRLHVSRGNPCRGDWSTYSV